MIQKLNHSLKTYKYFLLKILDDSFKEVNFYFYLLYYIYENMYMCRYDHFLTKI